MRGFGGASWSDLWPKHDDYIKSQDFFPPHSCVPLWISFFFAPPPPLSRNLIRNGLWLMRRRRRRRKRRKRGLELKGVRFFFENGTLGGGIGTDLKYANAQVGLEYSFSSSWRNSK